MLEALSNAQRREVLTTLLAENPRDDSPAAISDDADDSETITHLIEMRHVHLPKLADHEFIEWDREKGEVTEGPTFDEIRPLLELLIEHEDELSPSEQYSSH